MDDDLYAADVPQLSPFSRLPHELLRYVARQLSVADLGALRLASQHLSSILRVLLARKEFVGVPWRDNAARLDALSRWPECAAQIQQVRICSRAVHEDEEQLAWNSGDSAGPASLEAALWPTMAVARRLAAHPEEKRIVPLRADLLCEALCRLPKLEELALMWERFPFLSRADLGLDAELLNGGDDDEDADSDLGRQLAYTTGGWQREMLVDLATDMQPLRALKMAPFALDAMDQASYLPLITNLFNSLVRLDLQLTTDAQRADPSILSKLEDVLEGAWVLRELRLDLDDRGDSGEDTRRHYRRRHDDDDDFFLPKTHLANLQSLTLVRAHVASLRDLAAFLQRHARTLHSLELCDVRGGCWPGTNGAAASWEDVFRTVPGGLLKLGRARLRGNFADHARVIDFGGDGEEEDEEEVEGGAKEGNGEGTSHAPEMMSGVDPEPLERYLMRLGEFPTLEWRDFHV
ncbi:F-box domain, cyclin-like protein [Beauveria brongniartii RCEF 3172]|uniref:F-box domain, cyclin-like protein n=1 Tax=Beauveria brongniartii RCEF 3172 TaxID=1081107 RepID=A0A162JKW4_9HYPO|nr:F-box domain, cyclin-like protein [Beauveria brongniartii RCEF 3172]